MKNPIKLGICILLCMGMPLLYIQAEELSDTHASISDLLYILPSKDIYETGEDLWFKAWLLNRDDFSLSDNSKTLYLRIYAPNDSIVWDERYPIHDGQCDGHVYVGDKWSDGEYKIEGYTKTSFHKDSISPIFPRKILVISRIAVRDSLYNTLNASDSLRDAQSFRFGMYPEGGDLVYGLSSKVAFKATNGAGYPVEVDGKLTDNGKELIRFRSFHDGMGTFTITPLVGHSYQIVLSNGRVFPLPSPLRHGMTLSVVKQDTSSVKMLVKQSHGLPTQKFTLSAQMQGNRCCDASGILRDSMVVSLPMRHFAHQGIAVITLYNEIGNPVAERLIFVNPQRKLNIDVRRNENIYYRRDEGKLHVYVTDEDGNPIQAKLCVSILDQWYQSERVRETMLSHCYLSSQIRGSIHNPCYYFDNANKDKKYAMDLLMLTQGWRRIVSNPSTAGEFLNDEIRGKLIIGKKQKGYYSDIQAVQISGYDTNSHIIWTDSLGNFTVPPSMMESLRGGYVYAKPMIATEMKPRIEILPATANIAETRDAKESYEIIAKPSKKTYDEKQDISTGLGIHQLQGITVASKRRKAFTDKMIGALDSLAERKFSWGWVCVHPGESFLNDFVEGYTHHPSGTPYNKDEKDYVIKKPQKGETYTMIKYGPTDNVPWWIVKDIKEITYRGTEFTDEQLMEMNGVKRAKGYYGQREFYQPDKTELMTNLPDARNTLLWAPTIVTDENGEADISFLTSDDTGPFVGIIEGTDGLGLLGSEIIEFNVRRHIEE